MGFGVARGVARCRPRGKQPWASSDVYTVLSDPMEDRITQLEELTAHLSNTVDDLSDIVARQATEIALLTRKVQMLMEREAGREASDGGAVVMGDERPPHY